jgi:hypothetical protein
VCGTDFASGSRGDKMGDKENEKKWKRKTQKII